MVLYFVTEARVLSSSSFVSALGRWVPFSHTALKNYTTTEDTRSLSISSFTVAEPSGTENVTSNSALLFYEDAFGNVTALLQRTSLEVLQNITKVHVQWIDITSQKTKQLPDEFHNVYPEKRPAQASSSTLYDSDTRATFSRPFITEADPISGNGIAADTLFYSHSGGSSVIGDNILYSSYQIGERGPGNFSTCLYCYPLNENR